MQPKHPILLSDLNAGAGLALWGFRACARGASQCCVIRRGYRQVFGKQADASLEALTDMALIMGNFGARKIWLSPPGHGRVTADEVCILSVFCAAQKRNNDHVKAQLTWLLGGRPGVKSMQAAARVGEAFRQINLPIEPPSRTATKHLPSDHRLALVQGGLA